MAPGYQERGKKGHQHAGRARQGIRLTITAHEKEDRVHGVDAS